MAYSTDRIYNYTVSRTRRNVAKPGYRAYRLLDRACSTLVLRNLFANHDLALDRIHRSTNYPRHLARMIDRSMARRAEIRVPFLVCVYACIPHPSSLLSNVSRTVALTTDRRSNGYRSKSFRRYRVREGAFVSSRVPSLSHVAIPLKLVYRRGGRYRQVASKLDREEIREAAKKCASCPRNGNGIYPLSIDGRPDRDQAENGPIFPPSDGGEAPVN